MKWVDVNERLPEDGEKVLTYWARRGLIQLQTYYNDYGNNLGAWWMNGWQNLPTNDAEVTHWMSLPSPPNKSLTDMKEEATETQEVAESLTEAFDTQAEVGLFWCFECKAWVEIEGFLCRQGIGEHCIRCGSKDVLVEP